MPERGTVEDGGRDGDAARTEPTPDGGIALDGASGGERAEASTTAGSTDADDSDTAHAADADSISIPLPRPESSRGSRGGKRG